MNNECPECAQVVQSQWNLCAYCGCNLKPTDAGGVKELPRLTFGDYGDNEIISSDQQSSEQRSSDQRSSDQRSSDQWIESTQEDRAEFAFQAKAVGILMVVVGIMGFIYVANNLFFGQPDMLLHFVIGAVILTVSGSFVMTLSSPKEKRSVAGAVTATAMSFIAAIAMTGLIVAVTVAMGFFAIVAAVFSVCS